MGYQLSPSALTLAAVGPRARSDRQQELAVPPSVHQLLPELLEQLHKVVFVNGGAPPVLLAGVLPAGRRQKFWAGFSWPAATAQHLQQQPVHL